jgi:hypothetical protein
MKISHASDAATPRTIFASGLGPFLRAAIVVTALVVAMSFALAQDMRGQARQACGEDYKRFCAGTSPGDGRIRKCLADNLDKLSEACKQVMNASTRK